MSNGLIATVSLCLLDLLLGALFFISNCDRVYRSNPAVFAFAALLGTSLAAWSTGYWEHPGYEYEGDYVIMRLRIDLSPFTGPPQWAGGK